jgi:hypothetical protein
MQIHLFSSLTISRLTVLVGVFLMHQRSADLLGRRVMPTFFRISLHFTTPTSSSTRHAARPYTRRMLGAGIVHSTDWPRWCRVSRRCSYTRARANADARSRNPLSSTATALQKHGQRRRRSRCTLIMRRALRLASGTSRIETSWPAGTTDKQTFSWGG